MNRLQIIKWVIKEDPLCLIDLLNAIHEQQCCGGVADEERGTTDATAYDPAEEMVRMTGAVGYYLELVLHEVSSGLQKVGVDIVGAIQQIDNLLVVLHYWREDAEKKFSELFDKSKKIAKDFDIAMSCPPAARLSRYRSNIRPDDPSEFYGINVYIPLLDVIINDISHRFGPHQRQTSGTCWPDTSSAWTVNSDQSSS